MLQMPKFISGNGQGAFFCKKKNHFDFINMSCFCQKDTFITKKEKKCSPVFLEEQITNL